LAIGENISPELPSPNALFPQSGKRKHLFALKRRKRKGATLPHRFLKCFLPCIRGIGQLVAPQARNTQDREQPRRTAIFRGVEEASGTGRPAAAAITSGTKLT